MKVLYISEKELTEKQLAKLRNVLIPIPDLEQRTMYDAVAYQFPQDTQGGTLGGRVYVAWFNSLRVKSLVFKERLYTTQKWVDLMRELSP